MKAKNKKSIGIIGCGNMGGAILEQCSKKKAYIFTIFEKKKLEEAFICRTFGIKAAKNIIDLVNRTDILIIAVKPQDIDTVLFDMRNALEILKNKKILIVSIVAGISTKYIETQLGQKIKVIRTMPNMPAKIGEGMTVLYKGSFATQKDLKVAQDIFDCLGETLIIKKEGLIDAATAVSGSGPAYMYFIYSVMLAASRELGLDKKDSEKLIRQTILGSMILLQKSGLSSEVLRKMITSKGGTTEAALNEFEKNNLRKIIITAMLAAHKRAKQLSGR